MAKKRNRAQRKALKKQIRGNSAKRYNPFFLEEEECNLPAPKRYPYLMPHASCKVYRASNGEGALAVDFASEESLLKAGGTLLNLLRQDTPGWENVRALVLGLDGVLLKILKIEQVSEELIEELLEEASLF
jgi:hypothetical protein